MARTPRLNPGLRHGHGGMNVSRPGGLTRSLLAAAVLGGAWAPAACQKVSEPQYQGSATLSWVAPTADTSGKPLGALAGYKIYYGVSANALTEVIVLPDPGMTRYRVTNLAPGTWYFVAAAYTSAGKEGRRSNMVHKEIH
jgi:hypothetical protein